eukprot:1862301-Amphidinium_carterae.1
MDAKAVRPASLEESIINLGHGLHALLLTDGPSVAIASPPNFSCATSSLRRPLFCLLYTSRAHETEADL